MNEYVSQDGVPRKRQRRMILKKLLQLLIMLNNTLMGTDYSQLSGLYGNIKMHERDSFSLGTELSEEGRTLLCAISRQLSGEHRELNSL